MSRLPLCFCLLLLFSTVHRADGQTKLNKHQVFEQLRAHMQAHQPDDHLANFFTVADIDLFISITREYCTGIVVDPEYLANSSMKEWLGNLVDRTFDWATGSNTYDATPDIQGLYQSRGWSGVAHSVLAYEYKYAGYIILAHPLSQANMATFFHEALHCFAAAQGRTDLDSDLLGAPEFLGGAQMKLIRDLRRNEGILEKILQAMRNGQNQNVELKLWWENHERNRQTYFVRNDITVFGPKIEEVLLNAERLQRLMGGMSDWEGYEADVRDRIRAAEVVPPTFPQHTPDSDDPRKVTLLRCPFIADNYTLVGFNEFFGEPMESGEVRLAGIRNTARYTRCTYQYVGAAKDYSFGFAIEWQEEPDGLPHLCSREVGRQHAGTMQNKDWRGPYRTEFAFGATADQEYAHNRKVINISVFQLRKNFISDYVGWSHVNKMLDDLFMQVEPLAIPCK